MEKYCLLYSVIALYPSDVVVNFLDNLYNLQDTDDLKLNFLIQYSDRCLSEEARDKIETIYKKDIRFKFIEIDSNKYQNSVILLKHQLVYFFPYDYIIWLSPYGLFKNTTFLNKIVRENRLIVNRSRLMPLLSNDKDAAGISTKGMDFYYINSKTDRFESIRSTPLFMEMCINPLLGLIMDAEFIERLCHSLTDNNLVGNTVITSEEKMSFMETIYYRKLPIERLENKDIDEIENGADLVLISSLIPQSSDTEVNLLLPFFQDIQLMALAEYANNVKESTEISLNNIKSGTFQEILRSKIKLFVHSGYISDLPKSFFYLILNKHEEGSPEQELIERFHIGNSILLRDRGFFNFVSYPWEF